MPIKAPWVMIGNNRFECLHCHAIHTLQLPIPVKDFLKRGKDFTRQHERCRDALPKPVEVTSDAA